MTLKNDKLRLLKYLLVIIICLYTSSFGLSDYDYYWQAKLGKYIVTEHNFNGAYDLVWGNLNVESYLDHEWLSNIIFYMFSLLGTCGIFLLKFSICLFLGISICLMMDMFCKKIDGINLVSLLVVIFLVSCLVFKVKAYSISMAFVIFEIMLLYKYKNNKANKYLIYAVLLLIIWNNFHSGSMPLFFVIAGVFWLVHLRNKESLICGIVCVLSTGINPYGYKLVLFDLAHNNNSVMKDLLLDWRPIDAKEEYGIMCFIVLAIILFNILVSKYEIDYFTIIISILFLYLILSSARHMIYIIPIFILLLSELKTDIKYN